MRTLHFIPHLEQGGAERMLVDLTRADVGNEHIVVTLFDGPHQFTKDVRGEVLSLGSTQNDAPRNLLRMRRQAKDILRQAMPDLVVGWLYLATPFAALGKVVSARVAFSIHATDLDLGKGHHYTKWARRYARWAAGSGRCDVIHYCSEQGRQTHEDVGFPSDKSAYVPNAIDTVRFQPVDFNAWPELRRPARAGGRDGKIVIACAARFDPQKDHATLFQAMARLKARGERVSCRLAGRDSTPGNPALAALINQHGLELDVECLGAIDDMPAFYNSADVTVLSSAYGESMPLVILEALATNCPVVATDLGACRELVGPHGRIIPTRDPEALADAIGAVTRTATAAQIAAPRDHVLQSYTLDRFVTNWRTKINGDQAQPV
jgi:glycosyltransferase involved in cell wall biosynthesis